MRARVLTTSILTALLGPVLFVSAITPKEPAGGSGKASSTAPAATTSLSPEQPWFKFADRRAVPAYLRVDKGATVDADGLRGEAFTADSDFINKDFIFDVLFDPKQDPDGKPFSRTDVIVGIGQNEHNGGSAWCYGTSATSPIASISRRRSNSATGRSWRRSASRRSIPGSRG